MANAQICVDAERVARINAFLDELVTEARLIERYSRWERDRFAEKDSHIEVEAIRQGIVLLITGGICA